MVRVVGSWIPNEEVVLPVVPSTVTDPIFSTQVSLFTSSISLIRDKRKKKFCCLSC